METNNKLNTALELVYKAANEETKKALETNFPQLRKSDDEEIRKELISFVNKYYGEETKKEVLAYLEKQKERFPVTDFTIYHALKTGKDKYQCTPYSFIGSLGLFSDYRDLIDFLHNSFYTEEECKEWIEKQKESHYSPLCNTIKDKIHEYIANHFIADAVVKTDMRSIVKAMEEGVRLGKEEQQPAEWSEEDERIVDHCIGYIEASCLDANDLRECTNWLEDLPNRFAQSSWKPSEEQMEILDRFNDPVLKSLYSDLKKYFNL